MTSIFKRGETWWIDYYSHGRRRRQSLKTRNALEARLRQERLEDSLGREDSGPLLSEFAEQYNVWARSTKPASAGREKQRLDKILDYFRGQGILTMKTMSPLAIEGLRAHLLEKKLSRATINRYLQLLRGMFYRAIDWGLWSGPNPLRKVKFFREESQTPNLSRDEIFRIRWAARWISLWPRSKLQAAFGSLVELALNTGMRKSELLNLRWRDIKDDEAYVRGKGDRVRKVPLNRAALAVIERQAKVGEFIFDIPNRAQHDLLRRTVLMASDLAEAPFHFHQLRHRFASDLLEHGVDVVTIANILGHARPSTTLIYSHTSWEQKRRAVEMLDLCPKIQPQNEGVANGAK